MSPDTQCTPLSLLQKSRCVAQCAIRQADILPRDRPGPNSSSFQCTGICPSCSNMFYYLLVQQSHIAITLTRNFRSKSFGSHKNNLIIIIIIIMPSFIILWICYSYVKLIKPAHTTAYLSPCIHWNDNLVIFWEIFRILRI